MAGNIGKPVPKDWRPTASGSLPEQYNELGKTVEEKVTKYYPTPGTGGQEGETRTFTVQRPPTTQEALKTPAFKPEPTSTIGTRSKGKKGGRSKKVRRSRKQKRTTRKQRRH